MSRGNTESSWYISQFSPWCSYSNYIARRFCSLFLVLLPACEPHLHLYKPTYRVCSIHIDSSSKQHLDQVFILFCLWDLFGARERVTQKNSSSAYSLKYVCAKYQYVVFFQKEAWSLEMPDWCSNTILSFNSYIHSKIPAPSVVHIQSAFKKAVHILYRFLAWNTAMKSVIKGKIQSFLLPSRLTMRRYPISITGMRIMMSM